MPIRLAYISQIRWPSEIPAGPFNAGYCAAMARAGIEVHFVVRSAAGRYAGRYADPRDVLAGEYGIDPPDSLHVHVIKTPTRKPFSDRGLFFWRAGRLLRRIQRRSGLDAVMSRDTAILPFLRAWRRRGLVAVHDSHNFYMDLSARDDVRITPYLRGYQRMERRHLPHLDGLLPLLDVQADWYRRWLEIPIRAVHPGLNRADAPAEERFAKKTIGYVGTLMGLKGTVDILEAFARLKDDKVRLLLIGGRGAEETEAMRRQVADHGLAERAEVTGWLSVPELRARLNEVSVALLPLRDQFYNRYLTAPSKLFDYLASAVPVIASDLPAIRELAGDAALYVPAGDVGALSSAMASLLEDETRHRQLAEAAHRRAGELHWDRRGLETRRFLDELITARTG